MLARIRAVSDAAARSGALVPLATEAEHIPRNDAQGYPGFLVRLVQNSARKDANATLQAAGAPKKSKPDNFNPFLPYEQALYVEHVAPAHVLLLNKFNVVNNHVLIVTAEYEEQSSLLNKSDFTALWTCLEEMDGVAFYNAGRVAGASQRHKHLQIVPAMGTEPTLGVDFPQFRTPFERDVLDALEHARDGNVVRVSAFPFLHGVASLRDCSTLSAEDAAVSTMAKYTGLLQQLSSDVHLATARAHEAASARQHESGPTTCVNTPESHLNPFPYNLLLTRDYMMMVPRREEYAQGPFEGRIAVNSLGFAGCLLVRNSSQLEHARTAAMSVLSSTTFAP